MDSLTTTAPESAVYQHSSKPVWGIAVVAWERDGKRGYLFEDGELRVLKDGYYHFMAEVDVDVDRANRLYSEVERLNASSASGSTPARKRRQVTIDEQLNYFTKEYPEGFAGEKWKAEHRTDSGRTLKRHRDEAVVRAAEALSAERLDETLAEGAETALAAVVKVLTSTDLVPATQARALTKGNAESAEAVVSALRDLLWSDEPTSAHFDRWIVALTGAGGAQPTWMLVTAPLALARPQDHVCIRVTAFHSQATALAPRLQLKGGVDHQRYQRTLAMVSRIRERAKERDLPPVDLLDVHDFIRATMSPTARAAILASRAIGAA